MEMKKVVIAILLFTTGLTIVLYNYYTTLKKSTQSKEIEKRKYKIGDVFVDTAKREIRYKGKVHKDNGWVQFLIHMQGYKWLKEESAIISDVNLQDVQNAIALLDWKLWDDIWYRKNTARTKKVNIFVKWNNTENNARNLVHADDYLFPQDIIFLGSPYFDSVVVENKAIDCKNCPIFPIEKKVLKKSFRRKSGQSGYKLNSKKMPPKNSDVTIIIKIEK